MNTQQATGYFNFINMAYIHALFAAIFFCLLVALPAHSAENIELRESFAGNMDFALIGGSVRGNNECNPVSTESSSASLTIPSGSTIIKAYLWWSGSGNSDPSVNLNGTAVSADTQYTDTPSPVRTVFYSNKADVTSLISAATSSITISGLNYAQGNYCNNRTAYGGWSLVVIYEKSSEPLRVINIFDGFQHFYGSAITLVPDNFVVSDNPASSGGKHSHITWEGDSSNSGSRNGFNEDLIFEGQELFSDSNPKNNQFNSYSNTVNANTSGVDVDVYEIGPYLTAGKTSATTRYSSGADFVFLSAEIISIPNAPVSDLTVSSALGSTALTGQNATLKATVKNNGPSLAPANTKISFPLPNGITYRSSSGSGWSCSAISNNVECLYSQTLADEASTSEVTINLLTTSASLGSNNVTLTVSSSQFDNIKENNTSTATISVINADFSTSQKQVFDQNGGNVQPGDTIRYVIKINEKNGLAVDGISVTDIFQSDFTDINIISIPAGSESNINGQQVTVGNINLSAGNTASIVIDATLNNGIANGAVINNSAVINNPSGADQTATSATLTVSQNANSTSGNKPLYLYNNATMSRTPPGAQTRQEMKDNDSGASVSSWNITPALKNTLKLDSTKSVNVTLYLQHRTEWYRYPQIDNNRYFEFELTLKKGNTTIVTQTISKQLIRSNSPQEVNFSMALGSASQEALTISPSETLTLSISHKSIRSGWVDLNLFVNFISGLNTSRIILPALTVINVDNVKFYDKPYADTSKQEISRTNLKRDLYIVAEVTDPFGSFDITAANLLLKDANDQTVVNNTAMTPVNDSGNATKTFEYKHSLPVSGVNEGYWTAAVTAKEGQENEITHTRHQSIEVKQLYPDIQMAKTSTVISDPINGVSADAKAIPGAVLRYDLTIINTGKGVTDGNSITVDDTIPAGTSLYVGNLNAGSPVIFTDGTSPDDSSLTFTFTSLSSTTDDLAFSNNSGASYNYIPVADANGYDSNVTNLRFIPKGVFKASNTNQPQFKLNYQLKLD